MHWMPFEMDLNLLFKKVIKAVSPDRLIFGSDSSYFPRGFSTPYLLEQLRTCRTLELDKENIEKIFYKNAAALLKIRN